MSEIIYILKNEAMPGMCKLGKTSNLDERIRSLYQGVTGIPLPFQCFYAAKDKDGAKIERALHEAFEDYRVNTNREFFSIAPEKVFAILKIMELEDVTPRKVFVEVKEEKKALDRARRNRERFNFDIVNIPIGAELVFSKDKNIRAKVRESGGNRSVEYEGKITNPSRAAQDALGVSYGVAGTDYWMYEGETLDERRKRIESGE